MSNRMIKRHEMPAILIHWFNAIAWFFLLATGLGLIDNPALQPLGQWWPEMMRDLFRWRRAASESPFNCGVCVGRRLADFPSCRNRPLYPPVPQTDHDLSSCPGISSG